MAKAITLYGVNHTRPGIEPAEWYGVFQWRASRREALVDADLLMKGDMDIINLFPPQSRERMRLRSSQYRIEEKRFIEQEPTP